MFITINRIVKDIIFFIKKKDRSQRCLLYYNIILYIKHMGIKIVAHPFVFSTYYNCYNVYDYNGSIRVWTV